MIKSTVVSLFVALPFAVGAQDLHLQYEGVISSIDGCQSCTDFAVGDPISGLLKINPSLVPTYDRDPNPERAEYGRWGGPLELKRGADFATGFTSPSRPSSDALVVMDERHGIPQGAGLDQYGVIDAEDIGKPSQNMITIVAQSIRNLFEGTDIRQAFDLNAGEEGVRFFGAIFRGIGESASAIYLSLTRVSLTPGHCRP